MPTRHCDYENEDYDEDEFRYTKRHGWVHDRTPLHTDKGAVIEELPDLPGASRAKSEDSPEPDAS